MLQLKLDGKYRYTTGDELREQSINLVVLVSKIAQNNEQEKRLSLIELALDELESLKIKSRLLRDFNAMSIKSLAHISTTLIQAQDQFTKWAKYIKK